MAIGSSSLFSNAAVFGLSALSLGVIHEGMHKNCSYKFQYIPAVCAAGVIMCSWIPASIRAGIIFVEILCAPQIVSQGMFGKEQPSQTEIRKACCVVPGLLMGAAAEHFGIAPINAYALAILTAAAATYASCYNLIPSKK